MEYHTRITVTENISLSELLTIAIWLIFDSNIQRDILKYHTEYQFLTTYKGYIFWAFYAICYYAKGIFASLPFLYYHHKYYKSDWKPRDLKLKMTT